MKQNILFVFFYVIICIFAWNSGKLPGYALEKKENPNTSSSHREESHEKRKKNITFLGIGPGDSLEKAQKKANSLNFSLSIAQEYFPEFYLDMEKKFLDVMHTSLSKHFREDRLYIDYSDLGPKFNKKFKKESKSVIVVKAEITNKFPAFEDITFFFSALIDKPLVFFIQMDMEDQKSIKTILDELDRSYIEKADNREIVHKTNKSLSNWNTYVNKPSKRQFGSNNLPLPSAGSAIDSRFKPVHPVKTKSYKKWYGGNDIIFYTTIYKSPPNCLEPTLVYVFRNNISQHSKSLEKLKKQFESVDRESLRGLFH